MAKSFSLGKGFVGGFVVIIKLGLNENSVLERNREYFDESRLCSDGSILFFCEKNCDYSCIKVLCKNLHIDGTQSAFHVTCSQIYHRQTSSSDPSIYYKRVKLCSLKFSC